MEPKETAQVQEIEGYPQRKRKKKHTFEVCQE